MNINVLEQSPIVTQHKDILQSYNLTQNFNKPTRKGKSAIDHIITANECKVKENGVIPCDKVSDHDSPYAFLNARISRYQARFKYIRDFMKFGKVSFTSDFSVLPFSIFYGMEAIKDKVHIFNKLINDCLQQHAPLSKKKKKKKRKSISLQHLGLKTSKYVN